jgi:hypothetical protein
VAAISIELAAKSLQLNRSRVVLVASISAIVVTNATLLISILDVPVGIAIVAGLVFSFTYLPVLIILLEIMSRSNQSVTVFRTLGAKKMTIAMSVLIALVGAGLVGAIAGEAVGLMLVGAYSAFSPAALSSLKTVDGASAAPMAQGVAYVLASFLAGLAAAGFTGVRLTWNKLS